MQTDYFKQLTLIPPICRAISQEGYKRPTEIQQAAIPLLLDGKDLLATAQTGTGKTAAFALPMLQHLHERKSSRYQGIRALILAPTRELALQIEESFRTYGRHLSLRTAVFVGGVRESGQIQAIRRNPDILVATPGRLLDLAERKLVRLDQVKMLVLDEADRMLDMGFVKDVRKIVALTPRERQTMFFSATLPAAISNLASDMLKDPCFVEVSPVASVSLKIEQKVLFVEREDKLALLTDFLKSSAMARTLVFTRTKHRAERIVRQLSSKGISASSIHSNKSQIQRQRALAAFDRGKVRVLVATDIVARGIDVDGISHVVNFELPNDPTNYVHRIGRTARAGSDGIALSFCDFSEVAMLRSIEKLTKSPLTTFEDHPYHSASISMLGSGVSAPGLASGRRRSSRRLLRRGSRRRPH
ncbi:MAG: DEAD/DEAH box helicase [Candidatus Latescibacterota bacterium]